MNSMRSYQYIPFYSNFFFQIAFSPLVTVGVRFRSRPAVHDATMKTPDIDKTAPNFIKVPYFFFFTAFFISVGWMSRRKNSMH